MRTVTRGENSQLNEVITTLAALVQEMKDHKEQHKDLQQYHNKLEVEIFGKGETQGLRSEMDVIQGRVKHVWYIYGVVFAAIVAAVMAEMWK